LFVTAVLLNIADGACSGGWQSNFGYEYCADTQEESHCTARKMCRKRNSELASITSDDECDYIAGLMSVNFL